MATAIEYGLIAAGISLAIVGVVSSMDSGKQADPVKSRYERIDAECAKPMPDGSKRQRAYLGTEASTQYYALCPGTY